jgi:lysozyme family protein
MIDAIIDDVIKREGAKDTNNPNDPGGRTKYGISERWNPEMWKTGPPTLQQARDHYRTVYIVNVGFDKIQPAYLQEQLVDFGVLSGPQTAIMHLQKIIGLSQDGVLGPLTLANISNRDPLRLNNKLVDDRVLMLARITQRNPKELEDLFGWLTRALSFRQ